MPIEFNFSTNRFLPSTLSAQVVSKTLSQKVDAIALDSWAQESPVPESGSPNNPPENAISITQRFKLLWQQLKEFFNGHSAEKAKQLLLKITLYSARFERLQRVNEDGGPWLAVTNEMYRCYCEVLDLHRELSRISRPSADMFSFEELIRFDPIDQSIVINIPSEDGSFILRQIILCDTREEDPHLYQHPAWDPEVLVNDSFEEIRTLILDHELTEDIDPQDSEDLIDGRTVEYWHRSDLAAKDILVEQMAMAEIAQQNNQYAEDEEAPINELDA